MPAATARRRAARFLAAPWLALGSIAILLADPAVGSVAGQEPTVTSGQQPRYRVARLPEHVPPPEIDGLPNEAAWDWAAPMDGFVQVEPRPGQPVSQRTQLRLLRTDRALYVAYYAYDDEPDRIRATQRARDANLDPDDRIEILLATLGDGRNAFWFQIGPAGGQGDALIGQSGQSFQKSWDGIWSARSRRTGEGWFAEFEIPFATLDFDPALDNWGFNARRFVRRAEEEARWASAEPGRRFFAPSDFGVLEGMGDLERGLGLDIKPFVTGTLGRTRGPDGEEERDLDAGLDLFWRLGANAKLSASFNTDFAEAEVDERQINLTRFSLFFPEKRDFFLEDSSAFLFGAGTSNDVLPFFSRRIGLDAERRPVPILAAGKFVWRDERWSLGALNAEVDSSDDVPRRNLSVLRLQRRFAEQSDLGLIATLGDPAVERDAQTLGFDGNLRTRELFEDHAGRASAFWVGTRSEREPGTGDETSRGQAFGLELDATGDRHDARLGASYVDAEFDPRLGLARRPGTRTWSARYFYKWRFDGPVRRLEMGVAPLRIESTSGALESQSLAFTPLVVRWLSGDSLTASLRFEQERLAETFDLPGSLSVEPGQYDFTRYGLTLNTSDRRALAARLSFETGGFFDGQRRDYGLGLTWFQSALLNLGVDYDLRVVDLPASSEDLHIAALRAVVVPHQDLTLRSLLQYDSVSEDLGLDLQLRWTRSPGNDLFLVFGQSYEANSQTLQPTGTRGLAKVGWTLRL
jgi:hypothetical protein